MQANAHLAELSLLGDPLGEKRLGLRCGLATTPDARRCAAVARWVAAASRATCLRRTAASRAAAVPAIGKLQTRVGIHDLQEPQRSRNWAG